MSDSALKVGLVDYRAGNLHSLRKALEFAGAEVTIVFSWEDALGFEALVLPGVGAFGQASATLPDDRTALREAIGGGMPCLGICLGMQLYFEGSEEAPGEGIGVISGRIKRFQTRRVPQMGWNQVEVGTDSVFRGVDPLLVYYANSFVCNPVEEGVVIGFSEHEGQRFPAAVRKGNAWGFQFHPEKSSKGGLRLLVNWVREAKAVRGEAMTVGCENETVRRDAK